MKFDELFPRNKFPLRAKTVVHFPETRKHIKVSVYYEKPCESLDNQESGGKEVFVSNGKEIAVVVYLYKKIGSLFLLENGEWIEKKENSPEVVALDAVLEKEFGKDWERIAQTLEKKWVSF